LTVYVAQQDAVAARAAASQQTSQDEPSQTVSSGTVSIHDKFRMLYFNLQTFNG